MDERARRNGERSPNQRLRATEEARAVGFSERQARDGMLIKLYSPTGEVYYALKPDKPRIEVTNNGKRKIHKYEIQRTRAPVIVDVHPSLRRRLLVSEEPLYVTEGAKKADCLASRNRLAVEIFGVESRRVGGDVSGRRAFPTGMPCRSRVAGSTSPLTPTF